jgi:hypothetical protein
LRERQKIQALLPDRHGFRGRFLVERKFSVPLQAVKNPDLKEIVESLLLDFERHAATSYPSGAAPDFSAIRKRLGVPARKGMKIIQ